jgi:hypothetical protein
MCGRGDPNWRPSDDPTSDLLDVVAKGDVNMVLVRYEDGASSLITKQ